MSSSDIYTVKDSPQVQAAPPASSHRRRSSESFDEAVNKDVSRTHQRRHKNSGFRRFRHLMKKPEFSKKFWTITFSVAGVILILLVLWDRFLRYPSSEPESSGSVYESATE